MADHKQTGELMVITKAYGLILWSCTHTSKFPTNHRFVLGERTERNLYDLLETLIQARYPTQLQPLLEKVNLILEILRFQIRPQRRELRLPSQGVVGQAALPVLCIANGLRPHPQQAVCMGGVRFLTFGIGKAACPTLERAFTVETIRGLPA